MTGAGAITVTRVASSVHVEILRLVRNTCRGTFSHSNSEISTREQELWWEKNRERVMAWYLAVDEAVAGFALLQLIPEAICRAGLPRKLEACATTTVGVLPAFRGQGLGYELMTVLETATGLPLVACARLDNPAGMTLHRESVGWHESHRNATHVYYRREARA